MAVEKELAWMFGPSLTLTQLLVSGEVTRKYFDELMRDTPWVQKDVHVWGKTYPQPRLTAWYGEPDCVYSYSGSTNVPHEPTPLIRSLMDIVSRRLDCKFNSVLLNLYRDGKDSIGMHSDNEPELGENPTIASLSLGATRILRLKSRSPDSKMSGRIPLTDGSLLVMKDDCQRIWKHGISTEPNVTEPRINLTFRYIYPKE